MWIVFTTLVISLSVTHPSDSTPTRLWTPRTNRTMELSVLPRTMELSALPMTMELSVLPRTMELSVLLLGHRASSSAISSVAEVFPPGKVTIPALPYLVSYGVSGWLDDRPLVCGGANVATGKMVKSCYSLHKEQGWIKEQPMIQERFAASSATVQISSRAALWVLGGTDAHDHGLSSTSILMGRKWSPGPEMTGVRAGQCSLPVSPTSVLVTGGLTPHGSTTQVEMFSFSSHQWTSMPSLKDRRERHVCTQVWLAPDGSVVNEPGPKDVMAVVVAGGDAYKDASEHSEPVTSVEMLLHNSWTHLPDLPSPSWTHLPDLDPSPSWTHLPDLPLLELGRMSRPSGLNWLPGRGLLLLGGCWIDLDTATESCTNKVWKLEGGTPSYSWKVINQTLDEPLLIGNSDLLVPSNFFTAKSNKPRTGQVPFNNNISGLDAVKNMWRRF